MLGPCGQAWGGAVKVPGPPGSSPAQEGEEEFVMRLLFRRVFAFCLFVAIAASSPARAGSLPTITEAHRIAWTGTPALPLSAHFGATMAMEDATPLVSWALIGAPHEGAAQLVSIGSTSPLWTTQAAFSPTTSQALPVAIDGYPLHALLDPGGTTTSIYQTNTGALLVSGIGGGAVTALAKSVGILAVGQPDYLGGFGRVRIYEMACGGCPWLHAKTFVGPFGSRLGQVLAIDGSVLVAGAPTEGENGAVHVYARAAEWIELQVIDSPAANQSLANFGAALALDGDLLAIGAPRLDRTTAPAPLTDAGGVYIYEVITFPFLEFDFQALLRPSEVADHDWFGFSVDVMRQTSGGVELAAGAPGDDVGANNAGAVYRYLRGRDPDATSWRQSSRLVNSQPVDFEQLGSTVALGQFGVLAGAPFGQFGGDATSGLVLFFDQRLFSDGFESGDTSAWDAVVP